jgi:glycosyltransferase involved in cell wall biosynthesis
VKCVTIVAKNYLHFAHVLADSFYEFNPDYDFAVLVVDAQPDEISSQPHFEVMTPHDLNIDFDEFLKMALIYDVMELCTALKPWALEKLLQDGATTALYLDPDIFVYSSLSEIEERSRLSGIVLTPHGVRPMPRDGLAPSEANIMQSGIYNLGFIAVGPGNQEFLQWWQERLRRDAISDPVNMLFTDQRWIDLVPSYWNVDILRDPGYNVAYWNVDNRELAATPEGITVDGRPLRFFHFSGFDPHRPWILSKHVPHRPRVLLSENSVLAGMAEEYAQETNSHRNNIVAEEYRYGRFASGEQITRDVRRAYRQALIADDEQGGAQLAVPFGNHDAEIIALINSPRSQNGMVKALSLAVWERRKDLREAFPDPLNADERRFAHWARSSGLAEGEVSEWMLDEPDAFVPTAFTQANAPGVSVFGYFTAELGMGELGRLVVDAVKASGIPHSTVVSELTSNRKFARFDGSSSSLRYSIDIAVINADQMNVWSQTHRRSSARLNKTVGVWAWEVEKFPQEFSSAFSLVDEIWTISEFSRQAIAKGSPKPVYVLPMPKPQRDVKALIGLDRLKYGIGSGPYFLVMFDFLSVLERKNPFAAIEAFRQAFNPSENIQLVIKTINGNLREHDREQLRYAARDVPNIVLIDEYMLHGEVLSLMHGATAYVSLHRAEGYGLTCAEAMALGVPVIATRYSGNLDFMSDENSLLVDFELTPIGDTTGTYPSSARWAEPDVSMAARYMRDVLEDRVLARHIGVAARESIERSQDLELAAAFIRSRVAYLMPTTFIHPRTILSKLRRLVRRR